MYRVISLASQLYFRRALALIGLSAFLVCFSTLADNRTQATKELESRGIARTPAEFVKSIRSGNNDLVVLFLRAGTDPNLRTSDRGLLDLAPLHWALMENQIGIAKTLLEYGADPMLWATNPATPAFHLIISRSKDLALRIIESGVPIDVPDGAGRTPLFYAARDGNLEVAHVLIAKGASINAKDATGVTILVAALNNGQPEAAKLLLGKGASIDDGVYSPLILASERGYLDVVKMLLARGADFSRPSPSGDTALRGAARSGQRELVEFLIERGADVNQGLPLLGAAFRNRRDMVKLLLDKGADVNAVDKDGRSALWMVSGDEYEEMMRLLFSRGANASVQSIYGETALMRAVRSGQEKAAALLLAQGANLHAKDKAGKTALDHANGRPRLQRILLDHGANP
jgi:ankyrin repeat protein